MISTMLNQRISTLRYTQDSTSLNYRLPIRVKQQFDAAQLMASKKRMRYMAVIERSRDADFNLDPRRDAEYADFIAVYGILFDHAATGDTTLTQNEQNTLELIAYKHSTLAAGLAKVTLYGYTGIPFLETLIEPETPLTPKSMGERSLVPEIKTCKVYPNPTAGILMVEIPREFEKTTATVRNATGKVVHQEVLTSGMVTLNLRGLASGSYVLHLLTFDGALDETHQIQIAK